MTAGESIFWQQVASQLNPGWQIHLGPDGGQVSLAAQDTFLYLFDTSTMWLAAGATQSSEMLRARRDLHRMKLDPAVVAGLAGDAVRECGAANLAGDHRHVQQAMTAAVCSITATATWSTVMDRIGSPAGHWIWIAYRLHNGETLGRPVYGQVGRAFLQEADVHRSVRTALASDIGNPRSAVNQQVKAGGGAVLHPTVAAWAAQPQAREQPRPR